MKTRIVQLLLCLTLVALLPSRASAQVDIENAVSLSVNGFLMFPEGASFISSNLGLGWFSSSGLEINGFLSVNMTKFSSEFAGSGWSTSGFLFGKFRYNFIGESNTVPFLELGVGAPLDENAAESILYQGGAGLKQFINEHVSFDVVGVYEPFIVTFGATYYLH